MDAVIGRQGDEQNCAIRNTYHASRFTYHVEGTGYECCLAQGLAGSSAQ